MAVVIALLLVGGIATLGLKHETKSKPSAAGPSTPGAGSTTPTPGSTAAPSSGAPSPGGSSAQSPGGTPGGTQAPGSTPSQPAAASSEPATLTELARSGTSAMVWPALLILGIAAAGGVAVLISARSR